MTQEIETRGQLATQVLACGIYTESLRDYTVSATVDDLYLPPMLWWELADTCSLTASKPPRQAFKEAFLSQLFEQVRRIFTTSYVGPFCDLPSTTCSCSPLEADVPVRNFPFIQHSNLVASPQEGLRFDLDDFAER